MTAARVMPLVYKRRKGSGGEEQRGAGQALEAAARQDSATAEIIKEVVEEVAEEPVDESVAESADEPAAEPAATGSTALRQVR
jgi:hypothetical protein